MSLISAPISIIIFFFTVFLSLVPPLLSSSSSYCSEAFREKALQHHNVTRCRRLRTLNAQLAWNVSAFNSQWTRIDVVFGARVPSQTGWLAWGVNPLDPPQMVGTRAIIGIHQPNGSFLVNTYNITDDTRHGCRLVPGQFDDVEVKNMTSKHDNDDSVEHNGDSTISATLIVPNSKYNMSKLNHVWQVGAMADGVEPKMHGKLLHNYDTTETLDLTTGEVEALALNNHQRVLIKVHGILNIVGWGVFLPLGLIIARYYREYPFTCCKKYWFKLHAICQFTGYFTGTTGWAIGLVLGSASKYYFFQRHRLLAMFIFSFTTLQVLAFWLRPKPKDEYRKYWNMYHHFLGYGLLAVIIYNIFLGISILAPYDTIWKWTYIAILVALGAIGLSFEAYTWVKFWSRHSPETRK